MNTPVFTETREQFWCRMEYTPAQEELFKLGQAIGRVDAHTNHAYDVLANHYQQGPSYRTWLRWIANTKGRGIAANEAETPQLSAAELAAIDQHEVLFFILSGRAYDRPDVS